MGLIKKEFLLFLKDLANNNNREWFHANKKRYENELKKPFVEVVQTVIDGLNKAGHNIEIAPKDMIFRINRDIRFSKDKSPYKTNVGALISEKGRRHKEYPGYYLHIEQGQLMIGGGAYFMEKEALYACRQAIANDPKGFKKIINAKAFKDHFGGIQGAKNKRIPKEFVEPGEKQELIYNKQFYFMAELDPKLLLKDDALKTIISHYKAGKALNTFLQEAMS